MKHVNKKVALLGLLIAAICAVIYYFYLTSPSFVAYREAQNLYNEKKYQEAFDKVNESLSYNNLNKRSIKLRSDIHFEIRNEQSLKTAQDEAHMGDLSFNTGDYQNAVSHYSNAYFNIDNISKKAAQYESGQALVKELDSKQNELAEKISEHYYMAALNQYIKGDAREAFMTISKTPVKTKNSEVLKGDIAYTIAMERINEIKDMQEVPSTFYRDALYWLEQIPGQSEHYTDAQELIKSIRANLQK